MIEISPQHMSVLWQRMSGRIGAGAIVLVGRSSPFPAAFPGNSGPVGASPQTLIGCDPVCRFVAVILSHLSLETSVSRHDRLLDRRRAEEPVCFRAWCRSAGPPEVPDDSVEVLPQAFLADVVATGVLAVLVFDSVLVQGFPELPVGVHDAAFV